MKRIIFILFLILEVVYGATITLPHMDNFATSTDGYTGSGIYQSYGLLVIPEQKAASKNYDFGKDNANKTITLTMRVYYSWYWDTSDTFSVTVNGNTINYTNVNVFDGQYYIYNINITLDSNGKADVIFYTNEYIAIDFVMMDSKNIRNFTPVFNKDLNGRLNVIGNHNVCEVNDSGNCIEPSSEATNNNVYQKYVQVDAEAKNLGYINSSEANLTLQTGDTVVWAGLYWQGRIYEYEDNMQDMIENAKYVEFKTPTSGGYVRIESNETKFNWYFGSDGVFDYSGMADVTQYVKVSGEYFLANLQVSEGENTAGGWALAVMIANANGKYRKIVVYDGYQAVHNYNDYPPSVTQTLSGFYTPPSGDVDANFILFANESDNGLKDSVSLTDENGNTHYLSNALNPSDNVINGTISRYGENVLNRNPNHENTLGTDIDEFSVGKDNNTSHVQIIGNAQTTTDINLTSNDDRFFLSMFGISIQLYVPKVCYYDLEFYKNGQPLDNGANIQIGEDITVKFNIRNDGNETAKYVYIKNLFENNLSEYERNSTRVRNVLQTSLRPFDDNEVIGDLGVYYDEDNQLWAVGILGDSNKDFRPTTSTNGYDATVEFNFTVENDGNLSLNFYTDYNYTIGDVPKQYNGVLHECNDTNYYLNISSVISGSFNIVNDDFEYPNDSTLPTDNTGVNALHTQIVNSLFYLKLVKLADDNVTVEPFDGIVKVELINAENNATLSSAKYVSLSSDGNSSNTNLIYGEFNDTSSVAVKQATYKIIYLIKNNGSFATNHTQNKCLVNTPNYNCIWGMLEDMAFSRFGNNCPTGTRYVTNSNEYCDIPCAEVCAYKRNRDSNVSEVNETCLNCVFSNYTKGAVYSKDKFAIRPDRFQIASVSNAIKAGEFNLTVKAVDPSGNLVTDYNETLTVEGNSPTFEYNDTNASIGCNRGALNIIANAQFSNGEANVTLKYTEVGDLNLTLKEVNGSEFAIVDQNDTNDSARFITENSQILYFIPDHFAVSGTYNNPANGTFTYISSDLNMSAELNLTVKAENEDNGTTQNYNRNCYAQNFDLNVSYDALDSSKVPTIIYGINSTEYNTTTNNDLNFTNLSKNFFSTDNNGTAKITVKINFDKNYTNPVEEFNMTVRDVNVSDVNGTFGTNDINDSARFIYGRIKVSNVAAYSSDINTTFEYQYWTDEGWVVNEDHNDTIDGNVTITSPLYPPNPSDVTMNIIQHLEGKEKIKISTTHSLPYSAKIHLKINSWLWYHPLAKDYQNPSSTNTDCLTHPCLKLDFLKSGSAWGGVGAVNNEKFNEENRTSEINASHTDVNVSKSQVKKINW